MYSRVLVAPPVEPVSLAEIKIDRALDHDLHDSLLSALITTAREYCENFCMRSLVTQTRESAFDAFADALELPWGPVQEVLALEYYATGATWTPITDYEASIYGDRVATIVPALNTFWPTGLASSLNVVRARYVAGYPPLDGSPTDYVANIPASFKTAIKLLVGNWYENREATTPGTINGVLEMGVSALLTPYRIRMSFA